VDAIPVVTTQKVVSHYLRLFCEQKCINIEMQVILLEVDFEQNVNSKKWKLIISKFFILTVTKRSFIE
jgi:hypothetical protein